ncbi:mCG119713, isoform CRA_b [Mus musculus]|nr:mCG119713, isoform CRA_b [Mus musculus]
MDGVIYAEESAGGPWGALKVTLSSSEAPLYGSGLTSAFRTFSGYPAFRKTSRTDEARDALRLAETAANIASVTERRISS